MRKRMIVCDLCGADITHDSRKYKFKEYDSGYTVDRNGVEYENHEYMKFLNWKRMDMCMVCMMRLRAFIKEQT